MTKNDDANEILDLLELPESYKRFKKIMVDAGMKEESAMFMVGRLAREVQAQIFKEAMDLTKDQNLDFSKMSQEDAVTKLNEIFDKAKGLTLKEYADFLAEEKVREFERLGEDTAKQ